MFGSRLSIDDSISAWSWGMFCSRLFWGGSTNLPQVVLRRYFLEIGFKNPYNPSATGNSIIIRSGGGGGIGALRLDETQCPAGAVPGNNTYSKARMILWYITHDEAANTIFEMGSWCRWKLLH